MTRNEMCQYIEEQLLRKHKQSLIRLYKQPEEELRATEHSKLIELAAKIEWDAQELVISILEKNEIKHPNSIWTRIKENLSLLTYEYIQWERESKVSFSDELSFKERFLRGAQEKWNGLRSSPSTNNAKIMEAKRKNIQYVTRWCRSLRSLLEQELQGR